MVAYAVEPDFSGVLLHLSRLALHTRNMLHDARASLVITESDSGKGDPQTLARVSLHGGVMELSHESDAFSVACATYLRRLPEAEVLFGFADFVLFRLEAVDIRYVGGFARAYTVSGEQLKKMAKLFPV
jgi:heme iron utilization protein